MSSASDRDNPVVRSEISELQSLYCDLIDSRRSEAVARLFAVDGVLQSVAGRRCTGRRAITSYFEQAFVKDGNKTKHLVSNFVFGEGGGAGEVEVTSGFVFLWSDSSVVRIGAGRYQDVIVRDEHSGGWVFKSKSVSFDISPQIA